MPNFRWIAAQRMQRKTPSYKSPVSRLRERPELPWILAGAGRCLHSMMPMLLRRLVEYSPRRAGMRGHTWVARMAISAHVVSGNILHELLESLLVARLLAPAQCSRHVDDESHRPSLRCTLERECITAREATSLGTPKSERQGIPKNDGPSGFAVVEGSDCEAQNHGRLVH